MAERSEMRMMVTGGTGFLGRACVRRLAGEVGELHAVSRSAPGSSPPNVIWHAADLLDDQEIHRLMATVRPTHLLHAAWIVTPGTYQESSENLLWLEAGKALARSFGETGGLRFVGVGTCAEYDWSQDMFIEDVTPLAPRSLYGQCKASMWNELQACGRGYGFSTAWGRVFSPYGPGDSRARLIFSVIDALRSGRIIAISEGLQQRDFIHVDDVADLLVRLLFGAAPGAFNVGSGEGTSIRTLVTILATALDRLEHVRFGARPSNPLEPPRLVADISKLREVLGWKPRIRLRDGLALCLSDTSAAVAN